MIGGRRPGTRGPAALLLAGTLSLGVGVALHLDGGGGSVAAQDVGALPGSAAALSAGSPRPLADEIPVLSGLDELVPQDAPVAGGFEATARRPAGSARPTREAGPDLGDPTPAPA
ncbi:MAG: hypothetical protein M3235_11495, partial [Actinomycetota bacterium]|nr:hypothetical protein [Actinomycetota bacterium]